MDYTLNQEEQKEFDKFIDKIKSYPQGFEFTLNYAELSEAQCNGLQMFLNKAIEMNLIKSVSMGVSMNDITRESGLVYSNETFMRL